MEKNNKKYYFVYGTLKKGHGNHGILKDCKKITDFETEPEFTMFHLGGFPGVIKGGNTSIKGEIYEVEDEYTEMRLDRLEGYREGESNNLYNKDIIKFEDKDVFIYTFNTKRNNIDHLKTIESGSW